MAFEFKKKPKAHDYQAMRYKLKNFV